MDPDTVRREWADRSGAYSPAYYAQLGPNRTSEVVRSALAARLDTDAAVLELGCSSGRHLAHLADGGFSDLHGVEINAEAFEVMAEAYPDLAETGTFHRGAIEDLVGGFADDRFDAVYSVETLQHVHPEDAWVFEELARVAGDLLVTVENEGAPDETAVVNYVDGEFPLYYRDWAAVFADLGLVEVAVHRGRRDTSRVFRVPDGHSSSRL